ncbi:MAG: hypothetical protein GX446_08650 [Chthonomonadales bacterium]|nr:hypothetical protein [Chthonomonadales bacterium]
MTTTQPTERVLAVLRQESGVLCGSWLELRCTLRRTPQGRQIVDCRLWRRYPSGKKWYATRAALAIDPSLLRAVARTLEDAADEYDATEGVP